MSSATAGGAMAPLVAWVTQPSTMLFLLAIAAMTVLFLLVAACALGVYAFVQFSKEPEPAPPVQPQVQYIYSTPQAAQAMPPNAKPPPKGMGGRTPSFNTLLDMGVTKLRSSANLVGDGSGQVPTMKEAAELHEERNKYIKQKTPAQLLNDLKAGNMRFWSGASESPELTPLVRSALIKGQVPKVAVLGCADSRAAVEIVFDQGPGDLFVARNAGNSYGTNEGGTMDYAIKHLGIKLIVVMGHQGCWTVCSAAKLSDKQINREPLHLRNMLMSAKESLTVCMEAIEHISDQAARDRECVIRNAKAQVQKMLNVPHFKAKIDAGELMIVPAFYEMTSGIVDFIEM